MNADGQLTVNGVGEISPCFPLTHGLPLDMARAKKTISIIALRIGSDVRDELRREATAKGKTISSVARERLTKKPDSFRAWGKRKVQ